MANMMVIDSKFRRETSNFKVNFDASSVDPRPGTPVLIKHIEKNLKPEEFLGVVVTSETSEGGTTSAVAGVQANVHEGLLIYAMECETALFYVPSTGALSLNAPYVEEEEGGDDDDGRDHDDQPGFDPGTLN